MECRNLRHGLVDIGGVRIGHRLHDDRRTAADDYAADVDADRVAAGKGGGKISGHYRQPLCEKVVAPDVEDAAPDVNGRDVSLTRQSISSGIIEPKGLQFFIGLILNHMVLDDTPALDGIFRALSDPTRRAMLRSLTAREQNIGELAAPFDMSFAAASKHIRVLEAAGLVRRRVEGRSHICRIEPAPLKAADAWLRFYENYWLDRLDTLEAILRAEDEQKQGEPP
jgi:DNA-binding transcriptional ArsR family regulator